MTLSRFPGDTESVVEDRNVSLYLFIITHSSCKSYIYEVLELHRVFFNKLCHLAADRNIAHMLYAWRSVIGEEIIAIA